MVIIIRSSSFYLFGRLVSVQRTYLLLDKNELTTVACLSTPVSVLPKTEKLFQFRQHWQYKFSHFGVTVLLGRQLVLIWAT